MEQLNGTVTDAGATYINQQNAALQPVTIDHFILAYVPDIDETTLADPEITEVPATATFSQNEPIHKLAYNGDNAVTYSLMLAASAGDFDFNWYGVVTDTGVLLGFAHIPEVKKRANIGQVINRNFVVPFTNAKALTGAQVPVESWQFDNTIHLNRIDADVRAVNQEMYGHATFFADAGLVTVSGADYHVAMGNAVIGGIQITVPETTLPAAEGDFIQCSVTWAVDNQGNYSADVTVFSDSTETPPMTGNLYSTTLANIGAEQVITDQRQVLPHAEQSFKLLQQLAATLDDAIHPIGSTYTQYPGCPAPADLFGGTWEARFDDEGIFFRTPGGEALAFGGGIQQDQMQRITGEIGGPNLLLRTDGTPEGALSGSIKNSGVASSGGSGAAITRLDFNSANSPDARTSATTDGETRSINRTIRVWEKTAH